MTSAIQFKKTSHTIKIQDEPFVNASTDIIRQIQSSIPELASTGINEKDYYRRVYKPYLKKITKQIGDEAEVYKWDGDADRFVDHPLFPTNPDDIQIRADGWNVSIICFGKSLTYMFKYVAYLFQDLETQSQQHPGAQLHISFICDHETADAYRKERIETTDEVREKPESRAGFHRYLGHMKNKSNPETYTEHPDFYPLDPAELALLRKMNIYIVKSNHVLCKGVGAKRALIQYLNASFALTTANPTKYVCMTVDDNITGFYIMNGPPCHNRTPHMDITESCDFTTCLQVYNDLNATMDRNPHLFMSGVSKGHGPSASADTSNTKKDSHSIYKLIMTRSADLWENDLVYNPFFTRFMEDTSFNLEVGSYKRKNTIDMFNHLDNQSDIITAVKNARIRLTFGHIKKKGYHPQSVCTGNIKDYEEYLPPYLNEKGTNVQGIPPIYAMYYLYFHSLVCAGHVQGSFSSEQTVSFKLFNPTTEGIELPKESKYGYFTFPLSLFAIAYTWNRVITWPARKNDKSSQSTVIDKLRTEAGLNTDSSSGGNLVLRWIANHILRKTSDGTAYQFHTIMNTSFEIGYNGINELREVVNNNVFPGASAVSLKSNLDSICSTVMNYLETFPSIHIHPTLTTARTRKQPVMYGNPKNPSPARVTQKRKRSLSRSASRNASRSQSLVKQPRLTPLVYTKKRGRSPIQVNSIRTKRGKRNTFPSNSVMSIPE